MCSKQGHVLRLGKEPPSPAEIPSPAADVVGDAHVHRGVPYPVTQEFLLGLQRQFSRIALNFA